MQLQTMSELQLSSVEEEDELICAAADLLQLRENETVIPVTNQPNRLQIKNTYGVFLSYFLLLLSN